MQVENAERGVASALVRARARTDALIAPRWVRSLTARVAGIDETSIALLYDPLWFQPLFAVLGVGFYRDSTCEVSPASSSGLVGESSLRETASDLSMRRLASLGALVAAAGCAFGSAQRPDAGTAPERIPGWLDGMYADGTVEFRYPGSWKRSSSETFGGLVTDNVSPHPAFVSVRYFADDVGAAEAPRLAARTIRPPAGRGLTLLYTQTGYVGEARGVEVAFAWATRADTPVGPTMRTFVVPLRDGRTALLVLAAERPRWHGGVFRWVRETLRWTTARPPFRRPGGRIPQDY